MKSIIVSSMNRSLAIGMAVCLRLFALQGMAYAQYAPVKEVKKVGTHLEIDGERITPEEQRLLLSDVGGEDINRQWKQGSDMRNAGFGLLTGVGGVCVLALTTHVITNSMYAYATFFNSPLIVVDKAMGGDVIIDREKQQQLRKVVKISGYVALGTGVVTGLGAVLFTVGNKRLNHLADKVSLEYNVAPTGAGLTLYF